MRVWLTRSQPGAARQADGLRAAGYAVFVAPVLAIRPLSFRGDPALARHHDVVVFLSEHAARLAADLVEGDACRVFAVGQRTAEVLAQQGIIAAMPSDESSEGLLGLPDLEPLAGQRVLLVAGRGGRDVLRAALEQRGAAVTPVAVYERMAVDQLPLDPPAIDVVVAASGDGITNVARLWFAANGRVDVAVLVPSERVARIGLELGFTRIRVCRGAGTDALLEGLAALQDQEQDE